MTDTAKELLAREREAFTRASDAYFKACESSDPQHWMEAALLAQQHRNALEKYRLSARQQASVEEVAQTLDPSAFVDLGPGFKRAQKIEMELVTLKASALLAKYDIFQKVEG